MTPSGLHRVQVKARQLIKSTRPKLNRASRQLHATAKKLAYSSHKLIHRAYRSAVPVAKQLHRQSRRGLSRTRVYTAQAISRAKNHLRVVHHHVAARPHAHLRTKLTWYDRWHDYRYHHHTHFVALTGYIVAIVLSTGVWHAAFADDSSQSWDFSTPANFAIDSALEAVGSSVRHKAQNYIADADTMALYHLDEAGGTSVADASASANAATATNASFGAGHLNNALAFTGTSSQVSVPDSPSLSLTQSNSIEAWTKFASAFGPATHDSRQGIVDKGSYRLYYNRETGRVNYELANSAATTWTQQAGNDIKGSWDLNGKLAVNSQVAIGSNVYVALGNAVGDAEVWKWDGTTWTQVGGDGKNSSWADATYENVMSMTNNGNTLYAGLGSSAGDAEVWSCDASAGCTTWTKIGGDGLNSSWAVNTYEEVESMTVMGGQLYVGLGLTANDARVYRWNGSAWTWVGGFGIGAPYNAFPTGYEAIYSMAGDGANLYVGFGNTAGDADVWRLTGTTWTQVGGDALNSSWAASTYETVVSMRYYGSTLYAGLGSSAGDAEVWAYNGTTWTKVGGDTVGSSWDTTSYEGVYSFAYDGTYLYAGLGSTAGDNEIWRCAGCDGATPAWTKIGGDGVNSGFTNTHTVVNSLLYANSTLYAGLVATGTNAEVWTFNGTAWTRIGGGYLNKSWGYYNLQNVESMTTSGDYLYAGTGNTVAGNALVWRFDGTSWQMVGGQGTNGSWNASTYENVTSMISYGGVLYVGLGTTTGDAEVWMYDGTTWTKVGGDGVNGSWTNNQIVASMAVLGGQLYVGLGTTATSSARVYRYNGSTWTWVGGNGIGAPYNAFPTNYETILSMSVYAGQLYVGMGSSAGDADVWRLAGTTWTQVGGDAQSSSWPAATYEEVDALIAYGGKLYAGLGTTTGDAEVWEYNGATWTKIAGDGVNGSWADGQYEQVKTIATYNGKLYAGLGNTAGDGEVWEYDNGAWSRVGGSGVNSSWAPNTIELVYSLAVYRGKLYAGLGNTANGDAQVWSYGGNGFLQSNTVGQDTNWHHLAATYDGTTMKLYIDGVLDASLAVSLSMPDTTQDLLIGTTYGGFSSESGWSQGYFAGSIDEVRISDVARSSFTARPYSAGRLTVSPLGSVLSNGIAHWTAFSHDASLSGGVIKYRLSSDNGATWKYWNSTNWVTSADTTQANLPADINDHIATFPVVLGGGIKWQAVIEGDGTQRVALNSVTITGLADTAAPSPNAANVVMYKTNGGTTVASNAWTNSSQPYFTWDAATDADSDIYGYCLYLGQTSGSDPTSTKGLLGTSPLSTSGTPCSFIVPDAHVDFATTGYLATPLTSSASPYYLYVTAVDRAGNAVTNTTTGFGFRFDNTPPANPAFITAPSNFISTKAATLTWQTSGTDAAADTHSGVAGLQYRIGASSPWYGDAHTGAGDSTDLLANDGSYATAATPDYANLIEGNNTIYFRTWDQAGNVSPVYVTTALKINSSSPSSPQNVTATPSTNTTNSFAFSWAAPASFVGDASTLTYCYTVGVAPTADNCTYTSAGVTNITAGAYAIQPGENTFYVAAKDEAGNINYATAATTTFTANTSAPGIPLSLDVVDASIKSTSSWRLALTWEAPSNAGAGIANYRVYRSTNNTTFTVVATTSSTSLVDTGLSQVTYYYKIKACDSTNHCGAASSTVSKLPTGRFTEPASLLSQPQITGVTTRRATITWVTDRASDSRIALGTTTGRYSSDEVSNSGQVTAHTINLTNLSAGTTYYLVARWTDEDGNTGTSSEFGFTTAPAPTTKEVETIGVGLNTATIKFTSRGATKAKVYYGPSDSFGGAHLINTSTDESTYSDQLTGLADGTKYYYKINTFDSDGNEYDSSVYSFTTPAKPRISDLRFQPVSGEPTSTQLITWQTNVPTTSGLQYGPTGRGLLEASDSQLTTDHSLTIRDLIDNTEYTLIASSRDASGNLAVSDPQAFRTALDTRAPRITDVTIEPTIKGTGTDARGQIVVSWKTDEPSTSQVAFGEGASGDQYTTKTAEDQNYTRDHVVIVSDLSTSTVYHLKAISRDRAANEGSSTDQSAIIGRPTDSVLSIIFNALSNIFGFLK